MANLVEMSDDNEQPNTVDQSLIAVTKPVLWIARIVGLTPILTTRNDKKEYFVHTSSQAAIYSYVINFLAFTLHVVLLVHLYRNTNGDVTNVSYLSIRLGMTVLVNLSFGKPTIVLRSFIRRRHDIVSVLQNVHNLGVSVPKYYNAIPIGTYLLMVCNGILSFLSMDLNFVQAVISMAVDVGLPIVDIFSNFLYACQMSVLHGAIIKLNEDLVKFKDTPHPTTLRPIMKRHVLLRRICSDMNQTYGLPMLLTSTVAWIEITFCLFLAFIAQWTSLAMVCAAWSVLHSIPILGVVAVCQRIEKELQKTQAISIQSTLEPSKMSNDLLEQVCEWDLQLRQLPILFTANGFIYLNSAQVKTTIATIITHSVILVQNIAKSGIYYGEKRLYLVEQKNN